MRITVAPLCFCLLLSHNFAFWGYWVFFPIIDGSRQIVGFGTLGILLCGFLNLVAFDLGRGFKWGLKIGVVGF